MTNPQVLIEFADDTTRRIDVAPDQTVLQAALDAGLELFHQCKTGSCGSCVGTVENGVVRMRSDTSVALLPREIEQRKVLTCLAKPENDAHIRMDYGFNELQRYRPQRFRAWVEDIHRLNDSVVELSLEVDEAERDAQFLPGMYYLLRVPNTDIWRPYSMCSTVEQLPSMRFLIRLLDDGAMSTYLNNECEIDAELEIDGPHGAFKMQQPPQGPVVLIAGGTGLAPVLSILDTLSEMRWRAHPIYLHFGVNRLAELFYLDELAARLEWLPNLNLRITLVEPHIDWRGALGYATEGIPDVALGPDTEVFLCGPPPMVDAAVSSLETRGIASDQIHFESFIPAQEGI